jgi:hypothetical protein
MTTQEIVSKLWNLCNVLRDDGITYHQYVTELTYILFLKMAKETGAESQIPEKYRWDKLSVKRGIESFGAKAYNRRSGFYSRNGILLGRLRTGAGIDGERCGSSFYDAGKGIGIDCKIKGGTVAC